VRALDEALFRWINGWPEALSPVLYFLSEGNKMASVRIVAVGLLVLCLALGGRYRVAAILAVAAALVANETCDTLKSVFQMRRPNVELADVAIRAKDLQSFGTASSHAANTAAAALVFFRFARPVGIVLFFVSFGAGISRAYVGVHYPTQIVLGWFVGILVGLAASQAYFAIVRRRESRAEGQKDTQTPDESGSEGAST